MRLFSAANKLLFATLIFSIFIVSCSKDDEVVEPEKSYVNVDFETVTSVTQVKGALNFIGLNSLIDEVQYSYETFYFTYRTKFQGEDVIASGLLAIPDTDGEPVPILSVHHGTLTAHSETPSDNALNYFIYLSAASLGYAVVLPDFIGFGTTTDILHPYFDETASSEVMKDMILAARDYMADNSIGFDNRLFLAGYSQGGYVTFATQKLIESNPIEGITLVASAPAAGAYDLEHMKDFFFGLEDFEQPYYIPYIIHNYNTHYNWGQPLSDFFQDPYADRIPQLYDGSLTGGQINNQLTFLVPDLLQPDMVENFDTDSRFADLKQAMMDNTLVDWAPKVPTRLYHGTADDWVPYENSVVSYEKLLENGSTSVELIPIEGADHTGGILPYAEQTFLWFKEFN